MTCRTTVLWIATIAIALSGTAMWALHHVPCVDIGCALNRIERGRTLRERSIVATRMANSVDRASAVQYLLHNPIDTPAKKHLVMALYRSGEAVLEGKVTAIALEWDCATNRGSPEGNFAMAVLEWNGIDDCERRQHLPSVDLSAP